MDVVFTADLGRSVGAIEIAPAYRLEFQMAMVGTSSSPQLFLGLLAASQTSTIARHPCSLQPCRRATVGIGCSRACPQAHQFVEAQWGFVSCDFQSVQVHLSGLTVLFGQRIGSTYAFTMINLSTPPAYSRPSNHRCTIPLRGPPLFLRLPSSHTQVAHTPLTSLQAGFHLRDRTPRAAGRRSGKELAV